MNEQEKDKLISEFYRIVNEQKEMIEMLTKQIPKYNR